MGRKNRNNKNNNPVVRRRGGKIFPVNTNKKRTPKTEEERMLSYLRSLQDAKNKAAGNTQPVRVSGPGVPRTGFALTKVAPVEECWESGLEVLKSCGSAPAAVNVSISPLAMAKINTLMQLYPKIEWLAYLVGEGNHVEDIVIPKQKVTTVRVDVAPEGVNVPTIGVIHSHHDMGNNFSHTDDEYINQNHGISLCISHSGINGVVRTQTACGKYVMVKASVTQFVEGFDVPAFCKEAESLITKQNFYSYNRNNTNPHQTNNFTGHNNLGMEDASMDSLGVEVDEEDMTEFMELQQLGVVDLADAFGREIEEYPTSYELMDLVAFQEIVRETIRKDRNVKIFESLYSNLLDNNSFSDGLTSAMFNTPIELLDEMDGAFAKLKDTEQKALVGLLGKLEKAVKIIQKEEDSEFSKMEALWADKIEPGENTNIPSGIEDGWDTEQ